MPRGSVSLTSNLDLNCKVCVAEGTEGQDHGRREVQGCVPRAAGPEGVALRLRPSRVSWQGVAGGEEVPGPVRPRLPALARDGPGPVSDRKQEDSDPRPEHPAQLQRRVPVSGG